MKNKDLAKILEKIFKRKIRSNQNLFELIILTLKIF